MLTLFTPNLNGREIDQNDRHFFNFLLDLYQHISPNIINNFTVFYKLHHFLQYVHQYETG